MTSLDMRRRRRAVMGVLLALLVTVEIVAGADHHEIYSAGASGALIAEWTKELG